MPVQVIGADQGAEREAGEALRQLLDPMVGPASQLLIVVGAQCLGEEVQDIDLLLLGSFGKGIVFEGSHDESRGHEVRLVNLCLIVEVKDHSADRVSFDSQHVKVSYGGGDYPFDATDQVRR